jgi:hypothetical protein
MNSPRVYDGTRIPSHADNETVIQECIYLDKANPTSRVQGKSTDCWKIIASTSAWPPATNAFPSIW